VLRYNYREVVLFSIFSLLSLQQMVAAEEPLDAIARISHEVSEELETMDWNVVTQRYSDWLATTSLSNSDGELSDQGSCGTSFEDCSLPLNDYDPQFPEVRDVRILSRNPGHAKPSFKVRWRRPVRLPRNIRDQYELIAYDVFLVKENADYERYRINPHTNQNGNTRLKRRIKFRRRDPGDFQVYVRPIYASTALGANITLTQSEVAGKVHSANAEGSSAEFGGGWGPPTTGKVDPPMVVSELSRTDLTPLVDSHLLACIEQHYAPEYELINLYDLECIQSDIDNIDGLEHLFALRTLSLGNDTPLASNANTFSDLSVFNGLSDLSLLNLTGLITGQIQQDSFDGITHVILDQANLISTPDLSQSEGIYRLSLNSNQLTTIAQLNTAIESLSLRDNNLTSIDEYTHKATLYDLDLTGNPLVSEPDFSDLTGLCSLAISDSNVAQLSAGRLPSEALLFSMENLPALMDITALWNDPQYPGFHNMQLAGSESISCSDLDNARVNIRNNSLNCGFRGLSYIGYGQCIPIAPDIVSPAGNEVFTGIPFELEWASGFNVFNIESVTVEECQADCVTETNWHPLPAHEQPDQISQTSIELIRENEGTFRFRLKMCSASGNEGSVNPPQCSISANPVVRSVTQIEDPINVEHIWIDQSERRFKLAWRLPKPEEGDIAPGQYYFSIRPGLSQPAGTVMPANVSASVGERMWQSGPIDADDYNGAVYTVSSCIGVQSEEQCRAPVGINLQSSAAGNDLAGVTRLTYAWTDLSDPSDPLFRLSWRYDIDYLCSSTGRPDHFIVRTGFSEQTIAQIEVTSDCSQSLDGHFSVDGLSDSSLGSLYRVVACQSNGNCGAESLITLNEPPEDTSLPVPMWNNTNVQVQGDSQFELGWTVDNTENIDYYKITEANSLASQIFYTEKQSMTLQRIRGGEYSFSVQACRRDRENGDDCGDATSTSVVVDIEESLPLLSDIETDNPGWYWVDGIAGDLNVPSPTGIIRIVWSYGDGSCSEYAQAHTRPDYFLLDAVNFGFASPPGDLEEIDASNGDGNCTWESPDIDLSNFFADPVGVDPRFLWTISACKNGGLCGNETVVNISQNNTPNQTGTPQNIDLETNHWDAGGPPPDTPSTPGGPDELRPGHWVDPLHRGTGWSFYWANDLRYPETHPEFSETYDLLAVWYAHALMPVGIGGNLEWSPVWLFAQLKLDEEAETQYYEGTLYYPNKIPTPDPDKPCDNEGSCAVGVLRVNFGQFNNDADISVTINSEGGLSGISSKDFELNPIAQDVTCLSTPENQNDHYAGIWWNRLSAAEINDDFTLSTWIDKNLEASFILTYDNAGNPVWINNVIDARETSTGCASENEVESINAGPNAPADTNVNFLSKGVNPVVPTPSDYSPSNHQQVVGSFNRAYNHSQQFSGLRDMGIYLNVDYDDARAFSLAYGNNNVSNYERMEKIANLHDIRFYRDGSSIVDPETCEADGSAGSAACHLRINWFTDGDYPYITVFLHNLTNDDYEQIASAAPGVNDYFPTQTDYQYSISAPGQYRFELWKYNETDITGRPITGFLAPPGSSDTRANAMIALSGEFEVVNDNSNDTGEPLLPPDPINQSPPDEDLVSTRVGSLSGEFNVDQSGAATFSVPIMTAPGSGGVAPQVGLSYSSLGSNGPLGVGWSISGNSAIVRCGRTLEAGYDTMSNVTLTEDDRLCMDGQHLLKVGGSGTLEDYWAVGSEYRTEIESFTKVVSQGSGSSITHFTVMRKDGSVSEYGNTSDASIHAGTGDAVYAWALNEFADSAGNYMSYSYQHPDGGNADPYVEYYLEHVDYTGNISITPTQQPYARIQFVFTSKNAAEISSSISGGMIFRQSQRLLRIDSCADLLCHQVLRSYHPEYAGGVQGADWRSRMISLKECADTDAQICYQATSFNWIDGHNVIGSINASPDASAFVEAADFSGGTPVDLNGDGLSDFIYVDESTTPPTFKWRLSAPGSYALNTTGSRQMNCTILGNDCNFTPRWQIIDANADGYNDVMYVNENKVIVHFWTGSGLSTATVVFTAGSDVTLSSDYTVLDWNGDGLADIFYTTGNSSVAAPALGLLMNDIASPGSFSVYTDIGFSNLLSLWEHPGGIDNLVIIGELEFSPHITDKVFDANGDGSADLLMVISHEYCNNINNTCQIVGDQSGNDPDNASDTLIKSRYHLFASVMNADGSISLVNQGPVAVTPENNIDAAGLVSAESLRIVDINSDGLGDMLYQFGHRWHHKLNSGAGFDGPIAININAIPNDEDIVDLVQFADVDGDQYLDAIYPSSHDGQGPWKVSHWRWDNGNGAFSSAITLTGSATGDSSTGDFNYFADFNGDAKLDQLLFELDGSAYNIKRAMGKNSNSGHTLEPLAVIDTITDGFGSDTDITYAALTQRSVYTRDNNAPYLDHGMGSAVIDSVQPQYVVSVASSNSPVSNGAAGPTEIATIVEYYYAGAKLQAGGRGFLGFAQVASFDMQNRILTRTQYRQDFPYTGMPKATESVYLPPDEQQWPQSDNVASIQACNSPTACVNAAINVAQGVEINRGEIEYDVRITHTLTTPANKKISFPYASSSREWTSNLNIPSVGEYTSTATSYTETSNGIPDSYGNLTDITTITKNGDEHGEEVLRQITVNTFNNNAVEWHLGRLATTTVTHTRPQTSSVTRHSSFRYDSATGLLDRETVEPDDPGTLWLESTYTLDEFGNREAVQVRGRDIDNSLQTRWSYVEYDDKGRYPVLRKNHYHQETERFNHFDRYGNPGNVIDITGTTTTILYDAMGREYFRSHPSGAAQTVLRRLNGANAPGSIGSCPAGTAYNTLILTAGSATQRRCFDKLGREVRKLHPGFVESNNTSKVYMVDTYYDHSGRTTAVSEPYEAGSNVYWTQTYYDEISRVETVILPDASMISQSHQPLQTTTINPLQQKKVERFNALGERIEVTDYLSATQINGSISYVYDAVGNLKHTDGVLTGFVDRVTISYDAAGRKIAMTDPDKGNWAYNHNSFGELRCQKDALGQLSVYTYDELGRRTSQREYSGGTLGSCTGSGTELAAMGWQYHTSAGSGSDHGQLLTEVSDHDAVEIIRTFAYDDYGRNSTVTTSIDDDELAGQSFVQETTYDQYGRVFQQFDAAATLGTPFGTHFVYDANGHLRALQEAAYGSNGELYMQFDTQDARGHVTRTRYSNGAVTDKMYHPQTGRLNWLGTSSGSGSAIQDLTYTWDLLGNLKTREDQSWLPGGMNARDLIETFAYDGLNRLQAVTLNSDRLNINDVISMSLNHDASGNIQCKLSNADCLGTLQTYSYGNNAGPHALTQIGRDPVSGAISGGVTGVYNYDANGNLTADGSGRTLSYTAFERLHQASKGSESSTFWYDASQQWIKRRTAGLNNETVYRIGAVELVRTSGSTVMEYRRTIGGAVQISHYDDNPTQLIKRYLHQDHLGSIDAISNASGQVITTMSFDAFGARRDQQNWLAGVDISEISAWRAITAKGFTGHEMVDNVGIIHMGGRIYDASIGRFLQADPFIQAPDNSQSLNRYSYVMNNPLSYTDPSGFFFKKLFNVLKVAAVIAISVYTAGAASALLAAGYTAAGIGVAAAGGFVAGFIATGNLKGALIGAFAAAVTAGLANQAGVTSDLASSEVFASRLKNAVKQRVFMQLRDTIVGGSDSKATGGKFANGAMTKTFAHTAGNAMVGFGDGVFTVATFGFVDLNTVREKLGIQGNLDRGSKAFRGANFTAQTAGILAGVVGLVRGVVAGMGRMRSALTVNAFAGSRAVTFKTSHYAARLERAGINVAHAETEVAKVISAMRPNMVTEAAVRGRMTIDGVLIEYRARLLPNGTVNVGTIFPVVP